MKFVKMFSIGLLVILLTTFFLPLSAGAWEPPDPYTYCPSFEKFLESKNCFDDPRRHQDTLAFKDVLPPDLYEHLTYDIAKMKKVWAECVGFKAPEVVGKIAPEVKPGKYTYQDLEKHPGLKKLLWPQMLDLIKPGAPPHAGNIPEFEIIPTEQRYLALPIGEATLKNRGKTKLDEKGYIIDETWESGYPFPQPSGKFMAQETIFNYYRHYNNWGKNCNMFVRTIGFDKNLRVDLDRSMQNMTMRYAGRLLAPPYGWYDAGAKERGEYYTSLTIFLKPQDFYGTAMVATYMLSAYKVDQMLMYVPEFRRNRKMSATDTQDAEMGEDASYDDRFGFSQKLSPDKYPYTYKVIEDREYLFPDDDGSMYLSSKGLELRNVRMSRRPMVVLELIQQDPTYLYGKRIIYMDKEMLQLVAMYCYDQKGRLYRGKEEPAFFIPEMGIHSVDGYLPFQRDYIDRHTSINHAFTTPAFYKREQLGLGAVSKFAK